MTPILYISPYKILKLFVIAILLQINSHAFSAEYIQTANVNAGFELDSNPRMVSDEKSVWLNKVSPKYTITRTDDLNEQYFRFGYLLQRSSDELLSVDRDDPTVDLGWIHSFEKSLMSISARFNKSATRSSEIDESGELVGDADRISREFNANFTHLLNERIRMNIGGGYSNIDYVGNTTLNGFDTKKLNSSISYDLTPNIQSFLSISKVNQERVLGETIVVNTMVGLNWQYSDVLSAGISVGRNKLSGDVSGQGSAFMSNIKYLTENINSSLEVSRTVSPTGLNGFIESDKVKVNIGYDIDDNYTSKFSYGFNKNNTLNTNQTQIYRFSLDRKITKLWSANMYVVHKDLQNDFRSASANVLGIGLQYNHPDF